MFASAQPAGKLPIVIGQTVVLTGPVSSLSDEPLFGIRAMLMAVNASGGIHGRPLKLLQADDASDSSRAEVNVRRFVEAGAVAIVMPIGTASSLGALKAANELKVPLIGPYSGAAAVTKQTPYGFPVRISFAEEYDRIVNHLFTIGATRIVFVHNDNPGARSAMEGAKKSIENRSGKLLESTTLAQDGSDADLKSHELSVLAPEAIVLSVTNPVAAKFIRGYRGMALT